MLWGASSRMSETVSIWVPRPQPTTASASADAEHPPRRWRSTARSGERGRHGAGGVACGRREPSRHRRRPPRGARASARRRRLSAAKPAVRARPKAIAMPTTSSRPKLRTIGVGESCRARKPAAVARQAVRDRRAAARRGRARRLGAASARLDRLVEAGLELDRVVDGEADQDRQDGDRGHRQRAADAGRAGRR